MHGLCPPGAYTLAGKKIQRNSRQGKITAIPFQAVRLFSSKVRNVFNHLPLAIPSKGYMKSVSSMREGHKGQLPELQALPRDSGKFHSRSICWLNVLDEYDAVWTQGRKEPRRGGWTGVKEEHTEKTIWEALNREDITTSDQRHRKKWGCIERKVSLLVELD